MNMLNKNYQIGNPFNSLGDVLAYMYENPSVYYKPMNKVMPCKYFMNWVMNGSERFKYHVEENHFSPVKPKRQIMIERIQNIIKDCPNFKDN